LFNLKTLTVEPVRSRGRSKYEVSALRSFSL